MKKQLFMNAAGLKTMNWLVTTEPFPRSIRSSLGGSADDLRLKRAVKRAVERDLAPQTLIDSVRAAIRTRDESR